MGYTHYFTKKEIEHSPETWDKFLYDVKEIAARFNLSRLNSIDFITEPSRCIPIKIGDSMGEGNSPEFTEGIIAFNGVGDESYESFIIERKESMNDFTREQWEKQKSIFNFCKTNRRPYDLLVTAVLTLYKYHFKDKVGVYSDGGLEGFQEGVALVNKHLELNINAEEVLTDMGEE